MSFELSDFENQKRQFDNVENVTFNKLEINTELALLSDEFEEVKTISFTKCGYGIEEDCSKDFLGYFKLYTENESAYNFLGLSFINNNSFSYIDFVIRDGTLNLAKDDYLIILFEDGHKIKFTFQKPRTGNHYHSSNFIPLSSEILFSFLTKNIEKVKVVSTRKNVFGVFLLNEKSNDEKSYFKYKYTTKSDGQLLLRYMTFRFIKFNLENKS